MNFKRFKLLANILVVCFAICLSSCVQNPKPRIVSCSPTMTEILYELGARNQVVGATSFCFFPNQVMEDKATGRVTVIGDFININFTKIDSLKPDLILTETNMQRRIVDSLRAKGYQVLHYEVKSLDEVFKCILEVGKAAGKTKNARRMVSGMQNELQTIHKRIANLPRVRVYMEINHMGPWTFGSESPLQDMIELAGGINVFGDTAVGVFMTSNQEVVRRNPDIILSPIWLDAELGGWKGITPLYEIYTRPGYNQTNAVTHSRISYYDSALMKHYGPRLVLATKKLAYLLHPNDFENPAGTIPWELGWIK